MRTNNRIFGLAGLFLALVVVLCGCSKNVVETEEGQKKVQFRVVNYLQYTFEEGTRAAVDVGSAKVLKHLALGVFDAATDKLVGTVQVQDKGSEGYGTFSVTLPYGKYRLVFLGYGGDKALKMESPENISFADNYVPQTFLSCTEFTVNAQTAAAKDISLRRVVAGFELLIEDEIDRSATELRFKATGGGTVLNAKTGLAVASTGRESSVVIPEKYKGTTGKNAQIFLFLATSPEKMNIEVNAVNAGNEVLAGRVFDDVPMKVNTMTIYKGRFFSGQNYGFNVKVDEAWGETVENPF